MQKYLLLSILSLLYYTSNAQTPFAGCENAFFLNSGISGGANQPTQLHTIDVTTLSASAFGSTITPHINGVGYNQVDNFIYGLNDDNEDGTPNLYLIDATGAATLIAEVSPPPLGSSFGAAVLWHVGDIDQNGVYHFPAVLIHDIATADYDIYLGTIDLSGSLASPISPSYSLITTAAGGCQPLVDVFVTNLIDYYLNGGAQPSGGIQDWAFNPNDGMLYSYLGVEGYVFQLQANGEANCFATGNGAMTEFGGIFFDRDGDMHGFESITGNTYSITFDNCPGAGCGTLTAGAQHTVDQRLDVAACPWPVVPEATVPFAGCEDAYFLTQSNSGSAANPSTLSSIDTTDISLTPFGNQIPLHIDALGFNQIDNFLYGMNDLDSNGTPDLYRIDALGNYSNLTSISPPVAPGAFGSAVLWQVGDIDQNGIYYFPAVVVNDFTPDYEVYLGTIDLTAPITTPMQMPTYTLINTAGGGCQGYVNDFVTDLINYYNGGPEPSGGIQDWAFNPLDGLLYSYMGIESSVFTLDVATGNTNCYTTANAPLTEFGGIFFDRDGDMYGIESDAGNTYMIDVSGCPGAPCGILSAATSTTPSIRVDAASCPWFMDDVLLEPFPGCINYGVLTLGESGSVLEPTELYSVDTLTFGISQFGVQQPVQMNGMGFNYVDNFLYAMNDPDSSGSPDLYRIGVNGNAEIVTEILPPPLPPGAFGSTVLWLVGDIDVEGVYHFPAVVVESILPPDYTMYLGTIDLAAVNTPQHTPNYVVLDGGSCQAVIDVFVGELVDFYLGMGPEPSGGIQDWAFNPTDSLLYSYLAVEGLAFRMDPATAVAECFPTVNASLTEFGGVFFDPSGDMYAIEVDAGNTYMVDVSGCPSAPCGVLAPMAPYLVDLRGDAASCPWEDEPLPLELTAFRGMKDRYDINLEWTTNFEADIAGFKIERSANAIDFTTIGEVRAVGNSNQATNYSFTDEEPLPGLNYYRLTFTDVENNQEVYPKMVVVDMGKNSLYFTVNPNPTDEKIRMTMQSASTEEIQIEVFDLTGKKLIESTIAPLQLFKDIDVENLSPGLYLLKARNGLRGYVQRFVKQ